MKYLFRYLTVAPKRLALYMIIAPLNAAVDVGLAYVMAIAIEFATAGNLHQAGTYTLILLVISCLAFSPVISAKNSGLEFYETAFQNCKPHCTRTSLHFP